ncbi:MAG: hypothetical protein KAT65_23570 [Methanophagales archaeon]|nr:hypothetical protein [Methanophagales archaeon]
MNNTQNEHVKENIEKPYYGYRVVKYFIVALVAGGFVGIALAIVFTAWSSIYAGF